MTRSDPIVHDTVVIGAGQAGLAAGYHLQRRGRDFVILEASARVGDVWRDRYDSLLLYSPARDDDLPGLPFPEIGARFPTGRQMADYLETYADHFRLPVQTGSRVTALRRGPTGGYLVECEANDDVSRTPGDRRDRSLPAAVGPAVRRRARSADHPGPRRRVPQPEPAAGRSGARRRRQPLGLRPCLRARRDAPDLSVWQEPRPASRPARQPPRPARLAGPEVPRPARADPSHPDRAEDGAPRPARRWAAAPPSTRGPAPRRRRLARGADGRRPRRQAGPRRRPGARRRQRRVVHRLPAGLRLDRSARSRTTTAGRSSSAGRPSRRPGSGSSAFRSCRASPRCWFSVRDAMPRWSSGRSSREMARGPRGACQVGIS